MYTVKPLEKHFSEKKRDFRVERAVSTTIVSVSDTASVDFTVIARRKRFSDFGGHQDILKKRIQGHNSDFSALCPSPYLHFVAIRVFQHAC